MKLEQGIWYSFLIVGLTKIPDKGEHYILLLHESERKMLLKTDYYVKYNYSIGQNIKCKVDKVNCSGQVFLEPMHPFYTEGQASSFELIRIFFEEESLYNATVKDVFGNCIDVFVHQIEGLKINESVLLKVIRVKKGIPILSDTQNEKFDTIEYSDNKDIKLFVTAIKTFNSEEFYILSDKTGVKAKIKVHHYQKYGFVVGDEILCEITGNDMNNQLLVEPKNPWYKIGSSYSFKKVTFEYYTNLEGENAKLLVVLDIVGNKCNVRINELIANQFQIKDSIECKVVGFRKGRPLLEINQ